MSDEKELLVDENTSELELEERGTEVIEKLDKLGNRLEKLTTKYGTTETSISNDDVKTIIAELKTILPYDGLCIGDGILGIPTLSDIDKYILSKFGLNESMLDAHTNVLQTLSSTITMKLSIDKSMAEIKDNLEVNIEEVQKQDDLIDEGIESTDIIDINDIRIRDDINLYIESRNILVEICTKCMEHKKKISDGSDEILLPFMEIRKRTIDKITEKDNDINDLDTIYREHVITSLLKRACISGITDEKFKVVEELVKHEVPEHKLHDIILSIVNFSTFYILRDNYTFTSKNDDPKKLNRHEKRIISSIKNIYNTLMDIYIACKEDRDLIEEKVEIYLMTEEHKNNFVTRFLTNVSTLLFNKKSYYEFVSAVKRHKSSNVAIAKSRYNTFITHTYIHRLFLLGVAKLNGKNSLDGITGAMFKEYVKNTSMLDLRMCAKNVFLSLLAFREYNDIIKQIDTDSIQNKGNKPAFEFIKSIMLFGNNGDALFNTGVTISDDMKRNYAFIVNATNI